MVKHIKKEIKKEKKEKTNYINPDELLAAVLAHAQLPPNSPPSIYLCKAARAIADGLGSRPNYSGYSYIEDMKSAGFEAIIKTIIGNKYKHIEEDKEKGIKARAPFTYLTKVCEHVFYNYITKMSRYDKERKMMMEKAEQYIKQIQYYETNESINDNINID